MFRDILKYERFSFDGKSVLRALMNKDLTLLDLLVRESIQNSMDAAMDSAKEVHVDYITGQFDSPSFCNCFSPDDELISVILKSFKQNSDFLAIRDSNTVGLLGDDSDCEGKERSKIRNLGKLVYHLGMNQEGEGKGGAWGYGKTTYFKLGIGLVIFYSRTYEDGQFVSKLVISLVEDASPTNVNSLFRRSGVKEKTGIAWWGREHIAKNGNSYAAPIKDPNTISMILSGFKGVEEYSGNQTGTTIIIPYFKTAPLLEMARLSYQDDKSNPELFYTKTIGNFLSYSIQKWYFPRINNKSYGARLIASVNGNSIQLLPFFEICRKLYNQAKANLEETKKYNDNEIKSFEIKLTKKGTDTSFRGLAGIHCCRLIDFKTTIENGTDPYVLLFGKNDNKEGEFKPIHLFTRKPGMIVNYNYGGDGSGWLSGVPNSSEACPVSIFVANSNTDCKLEKEASIDGQKVRTIEDYLRSCEKAIHNDWQDSEAYRIVSRIKKNVSSNLCEYLKEPEKSQLGSINKRLSRAIAQWFLPQGIGNDVTSLPKKTTKPIQPKLMGSRDFLLKIHEKQYYQGDCAGIRFLLQMKAGTTVKISISIATETGLFDETNWGNDFAGMMFPCAIKEIRFNNAVKEKVTTPLLKWNPNANGGQFVRLPQGIKTIKKETESAFIIESFSDCVIGGYVYYKATGNWAVTIKAE